jgi:hypothetical protein
MADDSRRGPRRRIRVAGQPVRPDRSRFGRGLPPAGADGTVTGVAGPGDETAFAGVEPAGVEAAVVEPAAAEAAVVEPAAAEAAVVEPAAAEAAVVEPAAAEAAGTETAGAEAAAAETAGAEPVWWGQLPPDGPAGAENVALADPAVDEAPEAPAGEGAVADVAGEAVPGEELAGEGLLGADLAAADERRPEHRFGLRSGRGSRPGNWRRHGWRAVLPVGLAAVIAGLAVVLGLLESSVSATTSAAAARGPALVAAENATQNFLTVDYRHLSADLAKANRGLTPAFRRQYDSFQAKADPTYVKNQYILAAAVAAGGLTSVSATHARALLFVDEVGSGKNFKADSYSQVRVYVTMVNTNGRWLMSGLTVV